METTISKATIKDASAKASKAIHTTEAHVWTESISLGWAIRAERSYFNRPYRVAWVPVYSLVSPEGKTPIAGYTNRLSFIDYVNRRQDIFSK
jgi:hypothetical protein